MALTTKQVLYGLNTAVILLVVVAVTLRLHGGEVAYINFRRDLLTDRAVLVEAKKPPLEPLQVPWRFHVEEDGFVFPGSADGKERFLTYEQIKGPWTKQILQFENAAVFAFLLKRVLLVPSILPFYSKEVKLPGKSTFSMDNILDFDLLSSTIRLEHQDGHQSMSNYSVCHDPRLGFWVDYIPSVENVQTWRVLKAQYFYPVALNLKGIEKQYICPGTEQYIERWGPPIRAKPQYRGILTELADRSEDLILFRGDTLDTRHIRFFDQHRTKKAQELLLFYVRFSKEITRRTKNLAQLLGFDYNAILLDNKNSSESYVNFIVEEATRLKFNLSSMNILVVGQKTSRSYFDPLKQLGYNIILADLFLRAQADFSFQGRFMEDEIHLMSLLLCAYATNFVGSHSSDDMYFVEHLRLQDTTMTDGLVKDKVSVRWAKHTTRDKLDEHKALVKTEKRVDASLAENIKKSKQPILNVPSAEKFVAKPSTAGKQNLLASMSKQKHMDRTNNAVCVFCNYVRYVTGKHGCPTLKRVCG